MISCRRTTAWLALLVLVLSGCGQMGPLTIPDETETEEEESSADENER